MHSETCVLWIWRILKYLTFRNPTQQYLLCLLDYSRLNYFKQITLLWLFSRGICTIAKFRLLTKIDFNVMHLIDLCKFFWQKLQIRGSSDLLNSQLCPASILALQVLGIRIWLFCKFFTPIGKFSRPKSIRGIFTS